VNRLRAAPSPPLDSALPNPPGRMAGHRRQKPGQKQKLRFWKRADGVSSLPIQGFTAMRTTTLHSAAKTLLLVYSGGKQIADLCTEYGWLHLPPINNRIGTKHHQ